MFKEDYPIYIPAIVAAIIMGIGLGSGHIVKPFFISIIVAVILTIVLNIHKHKQEEQAQIEAAREKARRELAEKERAEREATQRRFEEKRRQAEERERIARMSAASQKYLDSMPKRKITFGEKDFSVQNNLLDMPQLKISTIRKDSSPEALKNYVVIDVETTGLDADHDEIIEVAAIRYSAGEVKEAFQTYVKPLNEIPMKITQINGITNEMVENAPHFSQIVAELEDFIGTSNLVGHNIEFDIKFLYAAGYDMFRFKNRKYYDSLKLARRVIKPDEVTNYKLGTLIHEYSGCFESANSHSALSDCLDTMRLFNMLLNDLGIY